MEDGKILASSPGLTGDLIESLERIDATRGARLRDVESEKAKLAVASSFRRLQKAAGDEAARAFLVEIIEDWRRQ